MGCFLRLFEVLEKGTVEVKAIGSIGSLFLNVNCVISCCCLSVMRFSWLFSALLLDVYLSSAMSFPFTVILLNLI